MNRKLSMVELIKKNKEEILSNKKEIKRIEEKIDQKHNKRLLEKN